MIGSTIYLRRYRQLVVYGFENQNFVDSVERDGTIRLGSV